MVDMENKKSSDEISINKSYAQNYNKWRRKEELQKYKDKYGDYGEEDDSSSSETEDEDAEGLTPQIEKDFFKTLSIIKSKDPKMYAKDAKFYESEDSGDEDDPPNSSHGSGRKKSSSRKDKPMYLKDYERKIIVEKEGKFTDDVEDEDEMEDSEEERERAMSPSYAQEQQRLKDSFFSAVHDNADDEEGDDGILTVKKKSKTEEEEEEKEYIEWLKGEKNNLGKDTADAEQLDPLRKYWTDPSLDDGEKFLRDFILNKGYIDKDTTCRDGFHMDDDDDDDDGDDDDEGMERKEESEDFSEEERQLEEQEDFERKYNFRYEEPDSEFIKRYPRTVAESVRRKDTSRAEKRQEKKSRQEQEKQKKREELKHLKNLKKQEIMERIEKLKEVTGNDTIGFDPDDLEGDFDPAEHDRLMQKVFSGEYGDQEEHIKPEFADEEELEEDNWDEWTRTNQATGEEYEDDQEYYDEEYVEDGEPHCDDADFNMDADYVDPSQRREQARWDLAEEMRGVSRKKRKKMSMFAKSLVKKKPVFNPEDKSFEDYIEEYYRLDYEDMIGDLPCRFKYRSVAANDFGLTTDEILRSREKELNQWASLKKTCQYRSEEEERRDVALFQKMGQNQAKKKRIFLSLQEESDSEDSEDADNAQSRIKTGARPRDDGHKPKDSTRNASLRKTPAGTGKKNKAAQPDGRERQSGTSNARRNQTVEQSSTGRNISKSSGLRTAGLKRPEKEINEGHAMAQEDTELSASSAKFVLSSREKKKQRKREILAKLKEMKAKKKVKRLQGMRGRVKVGAGMVSEARLRAYGINPKKHRYRMKNEAARKK